MILYASRKFGPARLSEHSNRQKSKSHRVGLLSSTNEDGENRTMSHCSWLSASAENGRAASLARVFAA